MKENYLIELKDVWKKYKYNEKFRGNLSDNLAAFFSKNNKNVEENEFWALQNINFKTRKGECLGIYGPNGSGKTTIIKLIASDFLFVLVDRLVILPLDFLKYT